VISLEVADEITKLCTLVHQVEGQLGSAGTPVARPGVDPAPWITAVEAIGGKNAARIEPRRSVSLGHT
jgi:hypothetical protein